MKTTLDLADDLLIEAKMLAARRRTTLKAVVESALRREIRPETDFSNPDPQRFEVGPFGMLSIKRDASQGATKQIQELIDHQYDEEDARVLEIAEKGAR